MARSESVATKAPKHLSLSGGLSVGIGAARSGRVAAKGPLAGGRSALVRWSAWHMIRVDVIQMESKLLAVIQAFVGFSAVVGGVV